VHGCAAPSGPTEPINATYGLASGSEPAGTKRHVDLAQTARGLGLNWFAVTGQGR
jgi:hypothetical protein